MNEILRCNFVDIKEASHLADKLSYLEKMEYLYVLSETKQLLNTKLYTEEDPSQTHLLKEDLRKIETEIESLGLQNIPSSETAIDLLYPYYEQTED